MQLEQHQRFSQSMLWAAQRAYYDEAGIEAWSGTVPFYITSNPYIADCYARIVVRFFQDRCRLDAEAAKHPFYIMELGTGSGQFSYLMVKALLRYRKELQLENFNFVYVMTDFTQSNVNHWLEHSQLQPYFEQGVLDAAVFDVEHASDVHLTHSNMTLNKTELYNPLVVFANYLFDSIVADIFAGKGDDLQETVVSISADEHNVENQTIKNWQQAKFEYTDRAIDSNYYDGAILNEVLASYKGVFEDTHFLFPSGSLHGIHFLNELSNNKLLLISSDKGYSNTELQDGYDFPELDFHGSFSLMVNFDAFSRYFNRVDGDAFLQSPRDGLVTAVFSSGMLFSDMPETNLALNLLVEGLSPTDYFNFYENLLATQNEMKLPSLVSHLVLSRWDPYIFEEISDRIDAVIEHADQEVIDFLFAHINQIADNFYYLPKAHDTLFDLAVLLQEYDHYDHALQLFERSEQFFPAEYELCFNKGLCYFYSERMDEAIDYFMKALQFDSASADAKEMLEKAKSAKGAAV